MFIVKPVRYDAFECLAGKCPVTCCIDWEIEIDEKSLAYYAKLKGEFGYLVKNAVNWMDNCFLQKDGRCVLYTEEGLCMLQKELGEEALCDACRAYPRHTEEYPDLRELSLSLSCPQAAAMICSGKITGKQKITGTEEISGRHTLQNQEPDHKTPPFLKEMPRLGYQVLADPQEETICFGDFDDELFQKACRLRCSLLEILHEKEGEDQTDQEWAFKEVKARILRLSLALQNGENNENEPLPEHEGKELLQRLTEEDLPGQLEVFRRMEAIGSEWEKNLARLEKWLEKGAQEDFQHPLDALNRLFPSEKWDGPSFCSIGRNLMEYFLYVYLPGAAYDGDILSKTSLAVFLEEWALRFLLSAAKEGSLTGFGSACIILSRFARQTEHSDANLNLLEEWMCKSLQATDHPC